MAYDEYLEERIAKVLDEKGIPYKTKKMMGGLTFMVDDKMCVGKVGNNLMARVGSKIYDEVLKKDGCNEMDFTGRPMKGYVFVEPEAIDMEEDLEYWIELCLDFNPEAKQSKKRK